MDDFTSNILKHYKFLLLFAYSLTKDKELAKDLVQDTYIKAITNRDSLVDNNSKPWLIVILRNTFINGYRRNKNMPIINCDYSDLHWIQDTKIISTISILNANDLELYISQLGDVNRIPFIMHIEGYKYEEISEKLNVPIGTIKSRIFQARQQLMYNIKNDNLKIMENVNEITKEVKETKEISISNKLESLSKFRKLLTYLTANKIINMNRITIETGISWPTMLLIQKGNTNINDNTLLKVNSYLNNFKEEDGKFIRIKGEFLGNTHKISTKTKKKVEKEIENPDFSKEKSVYKDTTFWNTLKLLNEIKPKNITINIIIN